MMLHPRNKVETQIPESLALIAGKGVYPLELAASARQQGVKRLVAVAFRGETDRAISSLVDEVLWVRLGQLDAFLDAFRQVGIKQAVMVGQITPTHIFRVRLDRAMLNLLSRLPVKNAETVFGAVGDELQKLGVGLLPAHLFMQSAMPAVGPLTKGAPTERQRLDIELGQRIAKATSGLDIGQTVVIKDGIVIAVEAFEGTDATILRAGQLAGPGGVVVKVAKRGHDMRFDIPVIGMHTMKTLRKARASVLALEAGRTILLERARVIAEAERLGVCMLAFEIES
jgi:DUF1009 family protein